MRRNTTLLKGDVVGTTTLERRAPYVERFTFALILPRLLLLGQMGMIGGFGVILIGMSGLMHTNSLPVNPFTAYADVFPGQPSDAVKAHGFSCPLRDFNYYQGMSEMYCRKTSKVAPFTSIDVVYASGVIRRLSFEIRESTFTVGDVAMFLNLVELQNYRGVLFNWRGHFGHAQLVNHPGRFSMLHRVWQVTLTDAAMFRP
jgi:hypothetical protein